jgi:hypothetical protein
VTSAHSVLICFGFTIKDKVKSQQAAADVVFYFFSRNFMKVFSFAALLLALNASADPQYVIQFAQYQSAEHGVAIQKVLGTIAQEGYQNQPAFSRDGSRLLWTAQAGEGPLATDIHWLLVSADDSSKGQPLRTTPFGEFSATPLPGSDSDYSVVRVEADGTQRLWQMNSQTEQLLYPELKGVGYHVWGADEDLLLFLLEDSAGPNRAVYRSKDGGLTTLAGHIGRALLYQASTDRFFFTAPRPGQPANSPLWLWRYQAGTKKADALLPMPANGQDLAVTSQGTVLVSAGKFIFQLVDDHWLPWADLSKQCDGKVSRFKLNPVQPVLAFVCEKES